MARKAIIETYYTFDKNARTIVIPKAIQRERLVLITDTSTNQVIFNFSDPNLGATNYVVGTDPSGQITTTTITLAYNTVNLANTDKLQIIVDEYDEKMSPSETLVDPINKMRVSTPQSLIDTDYEYTTQQTKWEQLALLNNRPFAYYNSIFPLIINDITATQGSRNFVVTQIGAVSPAPGSVVTILDTIYGGADGLYIVDSNNNPSLAATTGASNTFSYTGRYTYTGATGSIFNSGVTSGYAANTFSSANIGLTAVIQTGNLVTVTTNTAHGLVPGNEIALTGLAGSLAPNGSYVVAQTINQNTFSFWSQYSTGSTPTLTNNPASPDGWAKLYARPMGFAVHRSFDGGVRFSTNTGSHNQQYIRQTRRYFRYQSGKGIQMSTGTVIKTQFSIDSLTSNGAIVSVTTKDPHNIYAAMQIQVANANETAYNGIFQVKDVISPYSFTYVANTTPQNAIASGNYYASAYAWDGGSSRIGIFDSQNGLFFEHDGRQLWAVKRSSTFQVAGTVNVKPNSDIVDGNNCVFNKQLTTNDFIVIKGMSYRVLNILSDNKLQITPAFRGPVPMNYCQLSKTIDQRVPQSAWNIDRMDGTGPSGYNVDLTKMQMLYIDYSWYGAGFVRFGMRAADGSVQYAHKMINNNVNYLAYMRSGNLPGRYEVNTFSKTTFMTGGGQLGNWNNLLSTDTTVYANSTVGFPNSGILLIRTANNGGLGNAAVEYATYNGLTSNSFINLNRGAAGNTAGVYMTSNIGNSILWVASTGNNTTGIQLGQYVFGPNIAPGSFVAAVNPNISVTLNQAAIGNNSLFGVSPSLITFMPLANVAQTFLFSTTAQTAIELHTPQFSTEMNHWGTSAIMDGGFTQDKSFIFTKGMPANTAVLGGQSAAIMSFRLAPSVSNGIANTNIGVREIINRMQVLPFELDAYANNGMLITCYLNAKTSNTAEQWLNVGGSSLSQYIFHAPNTSVIGGEPVFGFYLNAQGNGVYSTTQQDLTQLLALGTSILSGGSANAATAIYPDGPDVLTVVAQNIGTTPTTIQARFSWNEAQA
jgi:hypothetical protein